MEKGKPDRIGLIKIQTKANDKRGSNKPNEGRKKINPQKQVI